MEIVTKILPIALAFIMLTLGLSLTTQDFIRVIKQPKDFLLGMFSQILILPFVAILLIKVWPISPELAVGLLIIAAAPGGVTSNVLTSYAKGDVALSISLTAVISLLSIITVPFIIFNSMDFLGFNIVNKNISLLSVAMQMFLIVAVPTLIGMIIRKMLNQFTQKFEPIANKISLVLFLIVLVGAIYSEKDNIVNYFVESGLITLSLNLLMMIIAFFLAHFFGSGIKQKKTIAIECGLQNVTLSIFVGTIMFGGGIYIIPAATYSLIMFATSILFVLFLRNSN